MPAESRPQHPIEQPPLLPNTRGPEGEAYILEALEQFLVEKQLSPTEITVENRINYSIGMFRFLRQEMLATNEWRKHIGFKPYPLPPQGLVEQHTKECCEVRKNAPAQTEKLRLFHIPNIINRARTSSPWKWRPQVVAIVQLGQTLRDNQHPLAGCITDILIAHSMAFDELAR